MHICDTAVCYLYVSSSQSFIRPQLSFFFQSFIRPQLSFFFSHSFDHSFRFFSVIHSTTAFVFYVPQRRPDDRPDDLLSTSHRMTLRCVCITQRLCACQQTAEQQSFAKRFWPTEWHTRKVLTPL